MTDTTDLFRGFIRFSKDQSFQNMLVDEPHNLETILLTYHGPESGEKMSGELRLNWRNTETGVRPMLEAYDYSWTALPVFQDVLNIFSQLHERQCDPDTMCTVLKTIGLTDLTQPA